MFNLQGSEIIFILLLALVVLGPEKLPSAIRRFTQTYAELRKMGTGFQTELKSALDEPMREMRETAGLIRDNADPTRIVAESEGVDAMEAERDAERRMRAEELREQRRAERAARERDTAPTPVTGDDGDDAVDEWADPVDLDDVPTTIDETVSTAEEAEIGDDEQAAPQPVRRSPNFTSTHPREPVAPAAGGGEPSGAGDDLDEPVDPADPVERAS